MKNKSFTHGFAVLICFSVILTSVMFAGVVSSFAATPTSGDAGRDVTWSYDSAAKTLTLSGTGPTYDFRATSIGSNKKAPWESYKSSITKVIVNEGITVLGDYSFYNCTALTSVQLPSTLTAINGSGTMEVSYGCFQNCTSLKTITLPSSLQTIGNCAFKGCTSLRLIKFPDSLTTLSYAAFCDCTALTTVTYGTGLTSTGVNAFYNSGVKKINFSSSITSIDIWSFFNTKIVELEIPEQITSIGTRAFSDCTFITNVTVYNRDCTFNGIIGEDPFNGSNQELVIHGHSNSTAQTYAEEHGYAFVSIDSCVHANTHTETTVEPTCVATGISTIVCDDCGEIVRTTTLDALGHTYEETASDDQTQANGHIYRTYTCSVCSDSYTAPEHQAAAEGSITDYVWVDGYFTYTNTSTCTAAGYERYVCTVEGCSRTENHLITLPGHNVVNWTVTKQPTCTDTGTRVGKCSECNETVSETLPAAGHTLDANNPVFIDDQTETDGHIYKTCACSVCGETGLVTEHSAWIDGRYTPNMIVTVTCTVNGLERDTCDICGETRDVTITAVGSHDFQIYSTTEATCTVRATTVYKCTQCGNQYTSYGDALGHDYIKSSNENLLPTCTEDGYDQYYCSRCSSSKREVVAALGHTPDEGSYTTTKEATCETEGAGGGHCMICGENYTEVIPALGHEYENATRAIENKPGHSYVTPTCVRCGYTQPSTISHDQWIEGYYTTQVVNEPGCIVSGNTLDTCTICNTTRNTATEALGHSFAYSGSLNPSDGNMILQCRYCRIPITVPANEVMGSWTMDTFGQPPVRSTNPESSYLDANGDEVINAKDYALIMNTVKEYDQRKANGEFTKGNA